MMFPPTHSLVTVTGTVEPVMTAVVLSMMILILVRLLRMIRTLPSAWPPWLAGRNWS